MKTDNSTDDVSKAIEAGIKAKFATQSNPDSTANAKNLKQWYQQILLSLEKHPRTPESHHNPTQP